MSEHRTPEPDAESPQGGVFGNLPGSRPGPRSPRRDAKSKAAGGSKPRAKAKPKPPAASRRPATPAKPSPAAAAKPRQAAAAKSHPARPNVQHEREQQAGGGLSDVAWAGIAVAAEAATIGVRLASRAIEAVRGNTERD